MRWAAADGGAVAGARGAVARGAPAGGYKPNGAAMIQRAVIHVDGPPGVGKTTFVERLLHGADDSVVVARCRRDETRRHPREAFPKTDLELRRYREAGANAAAVFTFPSGDLAADEFFATRLMEEYSQAVVVEGDSPLGMADLRVHVVPPLGPGRALLVRKLRDRAEETRDKAAAMERLLREPDGVERFLEQVIGGTVVDLARQRLWLRCCILPLEELRSGRSAGSHGAGR